MHLIFRAYRVAVAVVILSISSTAAMAGSKVLYVTHEPGKYHRYSPQLAIFKEKIAIKAITTVYFCAIILAGMITVPLPN